ncbi:tam domain methyltransferase [Colletotrichum truncatum]|uniref:Tam domain methyltransferase n=1 Tax=Colletotrichum truncatum TaxID=5467 RepID=A0ACC3YJ55_COLTU|nr:tam domain methyltransferase [Colletotrichum truncatum]KAF6797118.1 tam domain methyltransferase [Colletotrichum truncatum]
MADQREQNEPVTATEQPAAAPQPSTTELPPIEADTASIDESSSIGGFSIDDSQASITSSLLDYRRENGRTYHRLSEGKYYFPNDEQEQDRLDIVNHLWMVLLDGAFCKCPKNDGAKRVLDLGTGTGIWSLDYADAHPDAEVIGVDLSAIQPGYVPPNCSFELDDLEKEWTWTRPFDFIFCRNMIGSFTDWDKLIKKAYDNLEPGGYFEIQDSQWPAVSDDGSLKEDSALYKWMHTLTDCAKNNGQPIHLTETFDSIMEAVGFEEVQKVPIRFPVSPWPKDKKLRELGLWTQASLLPGIEGMTLAAFTRLLGWTREETLVHCAQVRKDIKDLSIHAYYKGYIIHGRKPLKADKEE